MSEILGDNPQVVDSKKDVVPVREETAQKLVVLKQDVGPINLSVPEKAPESNESKSSFDRVFEGTRSEIFSRENRMSIRILIEGKLELDKYKWLTSVHRENIALAMTDRLLADPDFQGIFRISIGFADMLNEFMKGNANKKTISENTEQTVETKSWLSNLEERITACASRVTMPLRWLLEKGNTPEVHKLLDNPQVLAWYNGGVVEGNVMDMTPEELQRYITGLNGKILEIDRRVLPLEDLRERGMDFIASGPDFLRNILKWIFEKLPFIGNMLASFLQYKDSDDALRWIDDELRQRRSLSVLRQFGRVTDMEGKEKDGEYTGKIDILKGKDLSGIKRKKLSDFFTFTREEGIDEATPDFWISVFNDGKITTKDKDGKEQVYEIGKITGGDLEKNFEGLYGKLNALYDKNKNQKLLNRRSTEKQTQEADEKARQEAILKQKAEVERVAKEVEPLKNLIDGSIINEKTVGILKNLTVQDFVDGQFIGKANKLLGDNPNKEAVMKVLGTYSGLLSANEKVKAYITNLKATVNGPVNFWTLSYQRRNLLIAAGFTGEWMKGQDIKNPETATVEPSPVQSAQKPTEAPKDPKVLIVDAFNQATSFPFQFWDKQVDFRDKLLSIGEQRFSLVGSDGFIPVDITNISFSGDDLRLSHTLWSKLVTRGEIATGLPQMLDMKKDATIEAKGKVGKIIITRVA